MKELFMVAPTTLITLVALLVFVVFVVIYKSKQQGTTYYSDSYSSEDVEEVRDYQEEKYKKSKSNKNNKKRNKNTNSDEEKNIDFATIWAFCIMVVYIISRTLWAMDFVLVFKWSFVLAGVVYTIIKLFVPVEIIKAFTSKDD